MTSDDEKLPPITIHTRSQQSSYRVDMRGEPVNLRQYLASLPPAQLAAVLPEGVLTEQEHTQRIADAMMMLHKAERHVDTARAFLALGDAATQLWNALAEKQAAYEAWAEQAEMWLSASEARCEQLQREYREACDEAAIYLGQANEERARCERMRGALAGERREALNDVVFAAEKYCDEAGLEPWLGAGQCWSRAIDMLRTAIAETEAKPKEQPNSHIGSILDVDHMAETGEVRELMTPVATTIPEEQLSQAQLRELCCMRAGHVAELERNLVGFQRRDDRLAALLEGEPEAKQPAPLDSRIIGYVQRLRAELAHLASVLHLVPSATIAEITHHVECTIDRAEKAEAVLDAAKESAAKNWQLYEETRAELEADRRAAQLEVLAELRRRIDAPGVYSSTVDAIELLRSKLEKTSSDRNQE